MKTLQSTIIDVVGAHIRVEDHGPSLISDDDVTEVQLNMVIHLEKLAVAYRDLLKVKVEYFDRALVIAEQIDKEILSC